MHYVYDDYLYFVWSKINYFLLEAVLETVEERQLMLSGRELTEIWQRLTDIR